MGSHHSSAEFPVVGPDALFVEDLKRTVAAVREPGDAVELALRETCAHAKWDFGQAWRVDGAERSLQPLVHWMREPGMQVYREASVAAETKYGIGLLWGAFLNSRPVVCLDFAAEPTFRRGEAAAAAGLRGGIFAPAMDGTEVVGVVEFLMKRPGLEERTRAAMAVGVGRVVGGLLRRV